MYLIEYVKKNGSSYKDRRWYVGCNENTASVYHALGYRYYSKRPAIVQARNLGPRWRVVPIVGTGLGIFLIEFIKRDGTSYRKPRYYELDRYTTCIDTSLDYCFFSREEAEEKIDLWTSTGDKRNMRVVEI